MKNPGLCKLVRDLPRLLPGPDQESREGSLTCKMGINPSRFPSRWRDPQFGVLADPDGWGFPSRPGRSGRVGPGQPGGKVS